MNFSVVGCPSPFPMRTTMGAWFFQNRASSRLSRPWGEEAAHNLRVHRGRRGGVSMELLLGEALASGLVRSGGLLATGAVRC